MNWETQEFDLLVMNTEGFYIDVILHNVDPEDLYNCNKEYFDSQIEASEEIDFDYLRNEYEEVRKDYNNEEEE